MGGDTDDELTFRISIGKRFLESGARTRLLKPGTSEFSRPLRSPLSSHGAEGSSAVIIIMNYAPCKR